MSVNVPPPSRRPFPLFAVAATFFGTLCAMAFGALVVIELVPGRLSDGASTGRSVSACPQPHRAATRARVQAHEDCAAAVRVQHVLETSGVPAANVSVKTTVSGRVRGPDQVRTVVVQLFTDDELLRGWRAPDMARTIAAAAGTDIGHVTIADDRLHTLFDGSAPVAAPIGARPTAGPAPRPRGPDGPPPTRR